MISTILLIAAFVLFVLAACGVPSGRIGLVPAGLAAWVLAQMISGGLFH